MRKTLGLTLLMLTVSPFAIAQQSGGGTFTEFGLTSSLRASDNWNMETDPEGDSFQFANDLFLRFSSETRRAKASVESGFELHHTDIAGSPEQSGIADPYVRGSYSQTGANSLLELNADAVFADREIDFSDSSGSERTVNLGGTFGFGQEGPFGATVSGTVEEVSYFNALDLDTRTTTLSVDGRVQLGRAVTLRPNFSTTRYEVEDIGLLTTDTTVTGLGLTAEISEAAEVTAFVNHTSIESTLAGDTQDTTGSLTYTITVPDGSHEFSATQDISNDGTRSELAYQRVVNTGALRTLYGLGAATGGDGSSTWTATLDVTRPFSLGSVRATVQRQFVTGVDGEETLVTDASVGGNLQLTDASGLTLDLNYNIEDDTGGLSSTDASILASYDRALNDDWSLSAGVEHRFEETEGSSAIRGNTLFVTVSRSWISSR